MPVRALEFYSGIGGLHLAFSRSGVDGSVIRAFDWDQAACQVYEANHPKNVAQKVDISVLTPSTLASYNADLWLLSPACQPYTVLNPNSKGASDPRAKSFLHLVQVILPDLVAMSSHPSHLLIENVAGFESSTTRQMLLSTLRALGYTTIELLITPLQFGIPNSRLRYYLLAKISPLTFLHLPKDPDIEIWRHIPGHNAWIDPRSISSATENSPVVVWETCQENVYPIREYLDEQEVVGPVHPNAIPEKVLLKWGRLFDIVLPSSRRTCCFTRGYSQLVERAGSVLQVNESLDTTVTFKKFAKAQKEGDKQPMDILAPLGLRYFSPSELLRLFDFAPLHASLDFVWPPGISMKTKYRLIGNSVNVRVVQELIRYLYEG